MIKLTGDLKKKYIIIKHTTPVNTHGGAASVGAWRVCPLNVLETNITGVSLASNRLTLPPAKYFVQGWKSFYSTRYTQVKLYNVTDSVTCLVGGTNNFWTWSGCLGIAGVLNLNNTTQQKQLELQYQVGITAATLGLGIGANYGEINVHTFLYFEKA